MREAKSFTDQISDLYHFFVNAQLNNEEVTYEQIQERLVDRSYDTLVWYANNFWTWFLSKKKEKRGRYRVFVCHDLYGYPEEFFVVAHQPRQGKYFYHFGKALDASRERAELRKQAKEQAGQQPTEAELSVPPTEVEQEFPEALHIADNEAEEGDEFSESVARTEPSPPPGEPSPLAAPPFAMEGSSFSVPSLPVTPPPPMTIRERIFDMFDFSRKNREAWEQLRLAIERLTRTLPQEREQLSREVTSALEAVKQTLETQTQQLSLLPTELSQLRADVIGQVQAIKQQMQTVEQTLFQEQQFREQVTGRVEELAEEIRQSRTPPDLASIRDMLQSSSEQLQEKLLSALQQSDALPGLSLIATTLTDVQSKMERIASLMNQFARHSSASPNGQGRAIQASIREAAAKAQDALTTLERECMAWLDELERHVQTIQRGHEETNKELQTISAYISPDEEGASSHEEEPYNGTVANEAQEYGDEAQEHE